MLSLCAGDMLIFHLLGLFGELKWNSRLESFIQWFARFKRLNISFHKGETLTSKASFLDDPSRSVAKFFWIEIGDL